jgi:hypothetical protein
MRRSTLARRLAAALPWLIGNLRRHALLPAGGVQGLYHRDLAQPTTLPYGMCGMYAIETAGVATHRRKYTSLTNTIRQLFIKATFNFAGSSCIL